MKKGPPESGPIPRGETRLALLVVIAAIAIGVALLTIALRAALLLLLLLALGLLLAFAFLIAGHLIMATLLLVRHADTPVTTPSKGREENKARTMPFHPIGAIAG